ncbi:xylulokinase, partial [Candidatus Bipolaricaulota bacterium]|nr:xylulokinase [Candidatus Bipolaricaulota bacterium]
MRKSSYLLGLDLGTTRVKAVAIDGGGKVLESHDSGYPLNRPTADAAEQDPEDWWRESCKVIRKTVSKSGIRAEEIEALAIAGQMHTAVFLDKNLKPLRPAITWADNRTSAEAAEIEKRVGVERLLNVTYNRSLPGFTASKVLWLKHH